MFRKARQHSWPDLIAIMKCEYQIGHPARSSVLCDPD
jgi:hypothetical protein